MGSFEDPHLATMSEQGQLPCRLEKGAPCTCEAIRRLGLHRDLMVRQSVGNGSGVHGLLPAETLSVDYQGTISPISVRGYNGFFFFKDLFSGFRHAISVKDKSGSTFPSTRSPCQSYSSSSENDLAAGTALQERHGVAMQPPALVINIRTP